MMRLRKLYATRQDHFESPQRRRTANATIPSLTSLAYKRTNLGVLDDVRESRASSAIIHGSRTLTQTFASLPLCPPYFPSLWLGAKPYRMRRVCARRCGITSINSRPLGPETFGPTSLKVNKTIRALVTLMFQPLSS